MPEAIHSMAAGPPGACHTTPRRRQDRGQSVGCEWLRLFPLLGMVSRSTYLLSLARNIVEPGGGGWVERRSLDLSTGEPERPGLDSRWEWWYPQGITGI